MPLHAIDDIGDAIDATKSFLLPFSARTWVKLAFVVFFIGGGGGGFNGVQNLNNAGSQGQPQPGGGQPTFDGSMPTTVDGLLADIGPEILAIVAIAVLLGLLFGLLSNFMEFVFVQSLVEREVHIRRYFGENIGNGLRLLAFRLVVSLVSLLLTVLFLYTLFVAVFSGSIDNIGPTAVFSILPLAILFFAAVGLVQGLITGFTNSFVVPMMLTGDRGLLGSWRRLLSSIRANRKQYLAFIFFSVVLGIGVGLIGTILIVAFAVLVGIPFVILGCVFWFALGHGTVALGLIAITGLLFALVLLLVATLVQVPLQAFMRYYAMLVLGDVDETLDPIPDVRRAVRPDDSDTPADAA